MEAWSFTADNPSLSICEYGTAMWMSYVNTSVVSTYCPNWLTFNYSGTQGFVTVDPQLTFGFGDSPNCLVCFSLDPSANGPYGLYDTVDLGANVYPSSSAQLHDTTAWLGNGGLKLHNWTSDPSVLTNGQVWYNSTSGQLKGYFAGTTICISGTGCSANAQDICTVTQALSTTSIAPGGVNTTTATCTGAIVGDIPNCRLTASAAGSGLAGYDVTANSGNVLTTDVPTVQSSNTITIKQASSLLNTVTFTPGAMSMKCSITR